jgi:hypothetical protein
MTRSGAQTDLNDSVGGADRSENSVRVQTDLNDSVRVQTDLNEFFSCRQI